MASGTFTVTPGTKGGAPQTNIGIRHAFKEYHDAVQAWLDANKAKAMPTNGEFEIRRASVDNVVITIHGNKKGKCSVSLQGMTIKFKDFPLPENLYVEDAGEQGAIEAAFGWTAVSLPESAGVSMTEAVAELA